MTSEQFHSLGIKFIGLVCLAEAIENLFELLPPALKSFSPWLYPEVLLPATRWLYLVIPPVLASVGLHLLKADSLPAGLVLHIQETTPSPEVRGYFAVAIEVYGLYLVAIYIPGCLAILINLTVMWFAPAYVSTDRELNYIQSALGPVLAGFGAGAFYFFKGRVIATMVVH